MDCTCPLSFVPSTAFFTMSADTLAIASARSASLILSFSTALTWSVTSSMRSRMEAVVPGFASSSSILYAQKPSRR